MAFSLGLDTGGTFTDAVIFDDGAGKVIAKAKSLTTRHDLSVGISAAAGKVIDGATIAASDIAMVSISTTLATNALVEGQGGRVALVMIGFSEADFARGGLKEALGSDPIIFIPGGHNVHGKPQFFDMSALEQQLDALAKEVSAVAVAGYFAVRNPAHEIAVRDLIAAKTNLAVTCSHELSSKLDGPRRALTTVLNARLIDMIARLIRATRGFMEAHNIHAPLMVVRGDGSLVSADFALQRPIETILSGPAASIVGAHYLTDIDDAIVSDIGGTTTDIAILDGGRPRIDDAGAIVGGYHTMVDAVAMRTFGLGGDSEISINEGAISPEIQLGPQRLVPVSLLATMNRKVVIGALKRQLNNYASNRMDGRFAMITGMPDHLATGLSKSQASLLSRMTDLPQPLDEVLQGNAELATLGALASRGLVLIGGLTPSDAQHALGAFSHWDREAASLAVQLFARKRTANGTPMETDMQAFAARIVSRLERLSAERILETLLYEDGLDGTALIKSPLLKRALDRSGAMARIALFLDRPLIGLGAGAKAYYPGAAETLGLQAIVPDDADVANAIGAVVGQVRVSVSAEILQNDQMQFEVLGAEFALEKREYALEEEALAAAREACRKGVEEKAKQAGAENVTIHVSEDIKASMHEDQRQFATAMIIAVATGRPAVH